MSRKIPVPKFFWKLSKIAKASIVASSCCKQLFFVKVYEIVRLFEVQQILENTKSLSASTSK